MTSTHDYEEDVRNNDIQIYINGAYFHRSEAKISVMDSGYLLGDGVWEGIRLHKGKFLHLETHLSRLYEGAKLLDIKLDLPIEKVILTVQDHGNTSSASIPMALDVGIKDGRIQRGQLILMEAFGGGFTWGTVLMRY